MRSMMRVLGGALLLGTAVMVSGCGEKTTEEKVEEKSEEVIDKVEGAVDKATE